MALTLSYIGAVGRQTPYEGKFWFTNAQRKCSQLTQTYTVPMGDYLVAWRGTLNQGNNSGAVLINNTSMLLDQNTAGTYAVGSVVKLMGVTSIAIRGSGEASFPEDPQVTYVRFG